MQKYLLQSMIPLVLLLTISGSFAKPTVLEVKYKDVVVNGKTLQEMTITKADGTWGCIAKTGDLFDVIVENKLKEPTVIHWHGLMLPNDQDGTELTQKPIPPNGTYHYQFKLKNTGTFWMHSHYQFQEANFAEAPLIIESTNDHLYQQVVVMFQDFSYKAPEKIFKQLQNNHYSMKHHIANMSHMPYDGSMNKMQKNMDMMSMESMNTMPMDLNDVKYDAYLTNYHAVDKPEVITVNKNSLVKLRFINGSSSSNFWINLGDLNGTAIAVDGHDIKPFYGEPPHGEQFHMEPFHGKSSQGELSHKKNLKTETLYGNRFQLAVGQRMDIVVKILNIDGAFPIIGQVEGLKNQTGLILTTQKKTNNQKIAEFAKYTAPPLDNQQELKLQSIEPMEANKKITQTIKYVLTGNMSPYFWQINQQSWPNVTPAIIHQGERVELYFINQSMMAHPIHLHGFGFKVIAIDGQPINGAIRDTVLVLPHSTLKVIFDATKAGKWLLHCHSLYHMHAGMMTYLNLMPLYIKK